MRNEEEDSCKRGRFTKSTGHTFAPARPPAGSVGGQTTRALQVRPTAGHPRRPIGVVPMSITAGDALRDCSRPRYFPADWEAPV